MIEQIQAFAAQNDWLWAGTIILVSIVLAQIVKLLFKYVFKRATKFTKTDLDDAIVESLERPVFVGVFFIGVFVAILSLEVAQPHKQLIGDIGFSAAVLWVAYSIIRPITYISQWFAANLAKRSESENKQVGIVGSLLKLIIFVIAILIILKHFGIEITPLLAGLGIGGLAVALALQEVLGNVFAGFYMLTDKQIHVGDYVETEGIKGYVKDINWRTTIIQTLGGNSILIPNSKMTQAVVTNYYGPKPTMSLVIPVGVAYDSNLEKVEKLTIDVAKKIQQNTKGALKDHEPFIRYNEFADSSINFSVILRVETYVNQYLVRHEFMKELKTVFDKNKIEIPFPQRDIHMKR